MLRVLIISPHFPPTNAADMQRVRLLLPYFREAGVEVEVLAVEPDQVAAPRDPWLEDGLPSWVPVHRVQALGLEWSRVPGLGTLSFRALGAIRRKGEELLGRDRRSEVGGQRSGGRGQGAGDRRQEAGDRGQRSGYRGQEEADGRCLGTFTDSRLLTPDSSLADSSLPASCSLPPDASLPSTSSAFDLVYFSTTQFGIHVLGPEWKRKYGVPFVMDYQDPWVSDYYREHPDVVPPGGRLKYAIASWLSRRQEPRVLRHCSGITSVSAAYPEQLAKRYPWLRVGEFGGQRSEVRGRGFEEISLSQSNIQSPISDLRPLPALVAPFPGDERDLERVRDSDIRQTVFDPNDGKQHWVYIGRGGKDMALAVRAIFSAIAEQRGKGAEVRSQESEVSPCRTSDLRPPTSVSCFPSPGLLLHFIGTSYAAAGRGVKTIEPLAKEYGLEDIVMEHPNRIPYSETLRCLLDADALIVPGSDDPGYTASKIYPYLLAETPLLAVFHEESSVVSLIRQVGGGVVVRFDSKETPDTIAERIREQAFDGAGHLCQVALKREAFAVHTASHQASQIADFFRACLDNLPVEPAVDESSSKRELNHR